MIINATYNISAISWRSVLLVEETGPTVGPAPMRTSPRSEESVKTKNGQRANYPQGPQSNPAPCQRQSYPAGTQNNQTAGQRASYSLGPQTNPSSGPSQEQMLVRPNSSSQLLR
jgi:hypothetical protein